MTSSSSPRPDDRYCGATNRAGGPCQRPAGWGTDHAGAGRCKLHGGSAPGGRKQGARLLAAKRAAEEVERLGGRVDLDPFESLELVRQGAAADVIALEHLVSRFPAAELAEGVGAALHRMLQEARSRAQSASEGSLRAGIDERRLRLSELGAAQLLAAIRGGLEDRRELLASPAALEEIVRAIGRRIQVARSVAPAPALEAGEAKG